MRISSSCNKKFNKINLDINCVTGRLGIKKRGLKGKKNKKDFQSTPLTVSSKFNVDGDSRGRQG